MKRGMGADARMQGSYRRQTRPHASDKESVIDHRSPTEAGQKIFSKDEGEYVDYTEE